MHKFIYDGKSSSDIGVYISGSGTFNAPERDITRVDIPGRNGTLTLDNGRFKNIPIYYPAFIRSNLKENAEKLREWLLSGTGYRRLEDTYHPEYYRMARFAGPINFDVRALNTSGEFQLDFDCMPQKFLKTGEDDIEIMEEQIIVNPTSQIALPLIRVYGTSGSITVNNVIVNISEISEYVDIDCETQDAYKGTENKNNTVSQKFPELHAGDNTISFYGDINKVVIKPRWWIV